MTNLLGLVGFIGAGKTTVAQHLCNQGFQSLSFATPLRKTLSAIFHWPLDLLEGDTPQSREWRETPDSWWSQRLGMQISPRFALQYIGTNVMREHFNQDIWVASAEKALVDMLSNSKGVVISDCRFVNEINLITKFSGSILEVSRTPEKPEWWSVAVAQNQCSTLAELEKLQSQNQTMQQLYPQVHSSEWCWAGTQVSKTLLNYQNLDFLYQQVDEYLKNH